MTAEIVLNLITAVIIIGAAVPTFYMALRLQFNPLRVLSILLGSFLLFHGFYHLIAAFEAGYPSLEFVSEVVIEPINWALLLAFTLYFLRRH